MWTKPKERLPVEERIKQDIITFAKNFLSNKTIVYKKDTNLSKSYDELDVYNFTTIHGTGNIRYQHKVLTNFSYMYNKFNESENYLNGYCFRLDYSLGQEIPKLTKHRTIEIDREVEVSGKLFQYSDPYKHTIYTDNTLDSSLTEKNFPGIDFDFFGIDLIDNNSHRIALMGILHG